MPMITLRPATSSREDVETLFEIRCSVRENQQSREELAALGITSASIAEMIEGGDYVTTIVSLNEEPAAFSMAQISEGYVFAVFVRPSAEGRGAGRAALQAAEQGLSRHGVKRAWLCTGAEPGLRAVGFYKHMGWVENGKVEDGQLRFGKQLM